MTVKDIRSPKSGRKRQISGQKLNSKKQSNVSRRTGVRNLQRISPPASRRKITQSVNRAFSPARASAQDTPLLKKRVPAQHTDVFAREVLLYFKKQGRHSLPWRKTTNLYRILVSEVMLQQTQVDRVIPYYREFLKKFPTVKRLAEAPLKDVLLVWQGLGYNRRAKMLHEAAQVTMINHSGRLPKEYDELIKLPGVGDYTAKAVRVFAHNELEMMIETNIRTAFLHHFFSDKKDISDQEIFSYMKKVGVPRKVEPRQWYAALMDYGAHLKRTHPNPSRRSKHHTKQKAFKGSDRQIRGAILKATLNAKSIQKLPFDKERVKKQYAALKKEGLI